MNHLILLLVALALVVPLVGCGGEDGYSAQDAEATVESRLEGSATEVNCIPEDDGWLCDVTLDIAGQEVQQDIRIDEVDIEKEGAA